ncbi:MAG TPA: PLP-dependent aminotransferase family protein [Candidatus Limnocylindrales bacterium]|nr:PLP-dependent aminotransferase family protein [Candidatus Limnocylindrales bacterium]
MQFAIPLSAKKGTLSRQIYTWLRRAILGGTLRSSERLPSTRDLADQLNVSRTVVLLAYEQLLAEGFVEGRAGSGTFVGRGLSAVRHRASAPSASLRLSRFASCAAAVQPRIEVWQNQPAPLRYDFAFRRSPVEEFPFATWRRILLRRARKASLRELDYGPPAGSLALCEAIAGHLRRSRAVVCDASQVIIVNGSQQALDLVTRVLLERGDPVAAEDPHYLGAREVFLAAGARLCPVPVDEHGLNPDGLPLNARLAFVTPSHQFPTGTILPLARRLKLLEWAKRASAVIIEDDYDGEFRYEGQPVESLQGLDSEGRVIYTGTFSRTVFPALRIGYLIAPKSLVPAFTAAKWLCDRHTATLEQETLAEFISSGAYERHLRRARRRHAGRRKALVEAVHKYLGDRVKITGDGSGAHVVLWPGKKGTEAEMIARAASHGVGVAGIAKYFLRRRGVPAGLMLGYSRLKEEEIREGIRRLAEIL